MFVSMGEGPRNMLMIEEGVCSSAGRLMLTTSLDLEGESCMNVSVKSSNFWTEPPCRRPLPAISWARGSQVAGVSQARSGQASCRLVGHLGAGCGWKCPPGKLRLFCGLSLLPEVNYSLPQYWMYDGVPSERPSATCSFMESGRNIPQADVEQSCRARPSERFADFANLLTTGVTRL